MSQHYIYTELPSVDYVRLIKIEPAGEFNDQLIITLMNAPFDDRTTPEYDALSYAWGDEENPVCVQMGGVCSASGAECGPVYTLVTKNLEVALRYLRQSTADQRLWWIDALCINQSDDVEKSLQVRKMGNIYRPARRVVAWLGAPNLLSYEGLEAIRHFASGIEFDYATRTVTYGPNTDDKRMLHKLQDLRLGFAWCQAVLDIIERPWLSRIWIRQEIYLADSAHATVQCGKSTLSWVEFRRALAGLLLHNFTVYADEMGNSTADMRDRMRSRLEMISSLIFQDEYLLIHLLRPMLAQSQCKDDRDRIYAVLEMLIPAHKDIGILPDYTKTASEVFHDVAVRYITHMKDARLLTECHLADGVQQQQPTWVPYWTHTEWQTSNQWRADACSDLVMPRYGPVVLDDPKAGPNALLRIHGVSGPIVQDLAPLMDYRITDSVLERLRKLRRALLPISSLPSPAIPDPWGDKKVMQQYASVLYHGQLGEIRSLQAGLPPPDDLVRALETCLSWQGSDEDLYECLVPDGADIIQAAANSLAGSRLALSHDSEILIVPESARQGDQVCALIGCDVPILLRPSTLPSEKGVYRVVGPCYSPSMSWGDAFLGPLPDGIVKTLAIEYHRYIWVEVPSMTLVSVIDPRLESLLEKIPQSTANAYRLSTEHGVRTNLSVNIEVLQEHRREVAATGGELLCFDLI